MTEHASSIAALGDRFGQLALANQGDRRPAGPAGFGTVGKAFTVRANHYPLQLNASDRSIIHYDLSVDGDDVRLDENGLASVALVRRVFQGSYIAPTIYCNALQNSSTRTRRCVNSLS